MSGFAGGARNTMKTFEEELRELIQQAHDAGYLDACWDDGGSVSKADNDKSLADLILARDEFIKKYGPLAQ